MRIFIFFIAAAAALGACSSDKAPPPQVQAPQPAAKTVFDTQLRALDKAKAVQDVVDKQNAAADKKLKDDGG